MAKARNYRDEYDSYHGTAEQKRNRASRNAARAKMEKAGKARKGQDIDHKNGNPTDNRMSNLQSMSKSKNRSKK